MQCQMKNKKTFYHDACVREQKQQEEQQEHHATDLREYLSNNLSYHQPSPNKPQDPHHLSKHTSEL